MSRALYTSIQAYVNRLTAEAATATARRKIGRHRKPKEAEAETGEAA